MSLVKTKLVSVPKMTNLKTLQQVYQPFKPRNLDQKRHTSTVDADSREVNRIKTSSKSTINNKSAENVKSNKFERIYSSAPRKSTQTVNNRSKHEDDTSCQANSRSVVNASNYIDRGSK